MGKNPFIVDPEESKVELAPWVDHAGKTWAIWLTLKRELSIGEHRAMLRKISSVTQRVNPQQRGVTADIEARHEWTEYSMARFEAYIVDWSLAHEPESKLPPTRASFEKLHRDLAELIDNAVDAHEREVSEEKKAGATGAEPSSTAS